MKTCAALLAAFAAIVPYSAEALQPANTSSSASYSIGIDGFVPVICHATTNQQVVATGTTAVDLGNLNEFCNNGNGFAVYADYSPELANASLVIDGKKIPLSSSGSALVNQVDHASIETHNLSLDLASATQVSGSISFRIVAL